ncbi:MAG: hypothetical protein QHI38_08245 [Armatimonadota bacterium]|nr:hypothetical protein [Armatimonadota bacterium]
MSYLVMSESSNSLFSWIQALEEEREILLCLLATTSAVRDSLKSGEDVSELLEKRDAECKVLKQVFEKRHAISSDLLPQLNDLSGGHFADRIRSLQDEITGLAEQLLVTQSECETIMKSRLQILAGALKESAQRRLVESAYGPVWSGAERPVFIDRQQ